MVLIEVSSSLGHTSYLFNLEERLNYAVNKALHSHFILYNVVGKVSKITRV